MEVQQRYTTRTGIAIAAAALSVVLISWVRYPEGEWNIAATGTVAALLGGLLTRLGVTGGMVIGAAVVVAAGLIVPKDPSGLGPSEIVIPIQLGVSLLPMAAAAFIGRALRKRPLS
jgi:hypothetical protein